MGKPAFTLDASKELSKLSINGDLTVQYAQELKMFLQQAMNHQGSMSVAFDQITSIDTATLQVVFALKKEIERNGRTVKFSMPSNESVHDLMVKTGITKLL